VELLLRYLLYVLIAVVFLLPFAWMVFGSLREEREIHGMMLSSACPRRGARAASSSTSGCETRA
jgi:ABC-type glycerol-3-phosphate transport system permease component